jgi:hypothetical protein
MNNFFRALIAGAAAKKFGGGCLGTIVIFVIVWVALGQCSSTFPSPKNTQPVHKEKTVSPGLKPAKTASVNYSKPKVYHYEKEIKSKAIVY